MEYLLDRCSNCGGVWLDKDEVDSILTRLSRGPLAFLLDWLVSTHGRRPHAR
jgi:Zn-finger nucleic acid-binding protein